MDIRSLHKIHRWLSAVALAATVAWFVSGALMAVPPSWRTLSPRLFIDLADGRWMAGPPYEATRVSVQVAVATAREHAGRQNEPLQSLRLRRFGGRLVYEVGFAHHTRFVDAIQGTVMIVDEPLVHALAMDLLGGGARLGRISRHTTAPVGYRGPLPLFSVPVEDGKGTVLYVSQETAEVRYSDRLSRLVMLIIGWHNFGFLQSFLPHSAIRALLLLFAVIGTSMSAAGAWILLRQLRGWQRHRMRISASSSSS
jgi:hypothetical protein